MNDILRVCFYINLIYSKKTITKHSEDINLERIEFVEVSEKLKKIQQNTLKNTLNGKNITTNWNQHISQIPNNNGLLFTYLQIYIRLLLHMSSLMLFLFTNFRFFAFIISLLTMAGEKFWWILTMIH